MSGGAAGLRRRGWRAGAWGPVLCACWLGAVAWSWGDPEDAARAAQTAARLPAAPESYVNFSFDLVELSTFAKLVGEMTGRKFVVPGDVGSRKITVVSPRISQRDAYPLFVSVLESAGCTVVEDEGLCRVVPMPDRATPLGTVAGPDAGVPAEGLVTKIFALKHVTANELRKAIEPQIRGGKAGAVSIVETTNHLLVTDTAESLRRVEALIAQVDRPGTARMTEVVALQFATADDLANELNLALDESENRAQRLLARLPTPPGAETMTLTRRAGVVASPHSNSLILVGSASQIEELKGIIAKMDVDAPAGRGRLNAIFLKYIEAEEAAKSLNALMAKSATKQEGAAAVSAQRIAIEASVGSNALLVDASPGDLDVVRKLVDQLDRAPQQVHISVLIGEVTANDEDVLGFQIVALDAPAQKGNTTVQGSSTLSDSSADSLMSSVQQGVFPRGITIGVAHGTSKDAQGNTVSSFPAVLNIDAMKKTGKFEILSETSLEAQNNREASLGIVNQIPILKSTVEGGSGTSRDVIQNIERVDVGIKLKLTPHIIPQGEVQMELNPVIEAVIDSGPSGTSFAPTIARREVTTTVTVPDRRTIVIAGLTRKDKSKTVRRVPVLGSIPFLGWMFRHNAETSQKTDLLIFVTPRIVTNMDAAAAVRAEWQAKTGICTNDAR